MKLAALAAPEGKQSRAGSSITRRILKRGANLANHQSKCPLTVAVVSGGGGVSAFFYSTIFDRHAAT